MAQDAVLLGPLQLQCKSSVVLTETPTAHVLSSCTRPRLSYSSACCNEDAVHLELPLHIPLVAVKAHNHGTDGRHRPVLASAARHLERSVQTPWKHVSPPGCSGRVSAEGRDAVIAENLTADGHTQCARSHAQRLRDFAMAAKLTELWCISSALPASSAVSARLTAA